MLSSDFKIECLVMFFSTRFKELILDGSQFDRMFPSELKLKYQLICIVELNLLNFNLFYVPPVRKLVFTLQLRVA